jgi:hypothetical protein
MGEGRDMNELALALTCGFLQAQAGFREPDMGSGACPNCRMIGFNTGWGYTRFACGAEILNGAEPEWDKPCPTPTPAEGGA